MIGENDVSSRDLSAISLFTGAGGLDLGFEAAGFNTRVAVEMDGEAVSTLRRNRPAWRIINEDIHSDAASSASILDAAELQEGDADVLIGGPPCQPFSKSGYWASGDAKRLSDPRADTLAAYLRVLRDTQPRAFLLENVPGLAFSRKDEGLRFIQQSIEAINKDLGTSYSFQVALLRAVEFGVPQDRQRVFVIGARDGTEFKFPRPTHQTPQMSGIEASTRQLSVDDLSCGLKPFASTWDAIGDLQDDDDPSLAVTGKWAKLLPSVPEGKNYLHHTARGDGQPLFGWRRRYWNFLLKISKRLPSWTIAAQPGPAIGPFHWRSRRLSSRELLRLQTFPNNFEVIGTLRSVQRQVGNAVPSALAEKLALEIRRQLFGESTSGRSQPSLIPGRRNDVPPPEMVAAVPEEFLDLAGSYSAHPGTGLGFGAMSRNQSSNRLIEIEPVL